MTDDKKLPETPSVTPATPDEILRAEQKRMADDLHAEQKRLAAKMPKRPLPAKKRSQKAKTLDPVTAAAAPVPPPPSKAKPSRKGARIPPKPKTKPGSSKQAVAERRSRFVDIYISNGRNATQAAISAGYSPKSAYAQAHELLKHPEVSAEVERRCAEINAKYSLTPDNVLREVSRIAFFDVRKLVTEDGAAKAMHEIDDDTAAAIAGVDIVEEFEGSGDGRVHVGYTKKFKIADKNAALDKAMKHLGLYEKDNTQQRENLALQVVLVAAPGVPR